MQKAIVKHKLFTKDVCIEMPESAIDGNIVIETQRGLFLAQTKKINENGEVDKDVSFVRIANADDLSKQELLDLKSKEKKEVIEKLFTKYNANMKLVDVVYTLDDTKVVISFVCEDRVDFRDLVKELASELKTRIELRQVGIRDQAKMVGCLGICGKECCCKQYLNDFDKVSIKMAKNQNLSLNPTKISGTCGRLMCCLSYENDTYAELSKNCPKINAKVATPDGKGTVLSTNVLKQTCRCRIEKGDDIRVADYDISNIKILKENKDK